MNHTLGPWIVNEQWATIEDTAGLEICAIHAADGGGRRFQRETCIANARLIAAAPDLLNALDSILANAGYTSGHAEPTLRELNVNIEYLDRARSAIAKATGR